MEALLLGKNDFKIATEIKKNDEPLRLVLPPLVRFCTAIIIQVCPNSVLG